MRAPLPGLQEPTRRPLLNGRRGVLGHHPRAALVAVIREGTRPEGDMPAWGGKLSEQEIDDIVTWLQSLWPDDVYAAWRETDQRASRMPG